MDIAFFYAHCWERWSPESLETGIGGSETALVHMSDQLAKLGHSVTVFAQWEGQRGGVRWIPFSEYPQHDRHWDVLVSFRDPLGFGYAKDTGLNVLWLEDITAGMGHYVEPGIMSADLVLCVSEWHRRDFCERYPFADPERVQATRNGIDVARFSAEPVKVGNRLIYSSSPDRGLYRLLLLFPGIRAQVPDAELHVYNDFTTLRAIGRDLMPDKFPPAYFEGFEKLLKETPGVVWHGRVGQTELAKAFLEAKAWAYPTDFEETSCITAMEAQAAACLPITTLKGALPETVWHGIMLGGPTSDPGYQVAFVDRVVRLLRGDSDLVDYAKVARECALREFDWSLVAAEWDDIFKRLLTSAQN